MKIKFKKFISMLLALIMALGVMASVPITAGAAESGEVASAKVSGDYEYNILGDGTVKITGYSGSDAELTIPSEIDGKKVTLIDNFAFSKCSNLTSVTIPDSVTEIGSSAFENCTSLTSVTIPDSVTYIGWQAFYGCTSLTLVTILDSITPDSVTEISGGAFGYYYDTISETDKKIESFTICGYTYSVAEEYATQNGFEFVSIGEVSPWSYYDNIEDGTITIADYRGIDAQLIVPSEIDGKQVVSIADWAFAGNLNIMSLVIPEGIISIYNGAFSGCKNLTSISLPNSLTRIGWDAFRHCANLTSVIIPKNMQIIDDKAFYECTNLHTVTILSEDVLFIYPGAFGFYHDAENQAIRKVDGFTICGYAGSAAEEYATTNEFTFVNVGKYFKDDSTNISVSANVDAELSVKHVTDSESLNKASSVLDKSETLLALYDISLIKDGAAVQPDGTATVKIPTDSKTAKVYRLEANGTKTDMNAVFENGYMVFKTEHFSEYILAVSKCLLGDANGDGKVNLVDAILALKHNLKLVKLTGDNLLAADVNGDGDVKLQDAIILQKYGLGLDSEFPIGKPIE